MTKVDIVFVDNSSNEDEEVSTFNEEYEEEISNFIKVYLTSSNLKHNVRIELWKPDEFYDYFTLPEVVRKADGEYRPVEGIHMNYEDGRGLAIVVNENVYSTLIHELTHIIDFDKYSNRTYYILNKLLKPFRRFDPFEKRAWKNQLEFEKYGVMAIKNG